MSKTEKHTPGPWEAVGLTICANTEATQGRGKIAQAATYIESAAVANEGEECANARLMAAAPDLLAALEKLAKWTGKAIADGAFASCVNPHAAEVDLAQAEAASRAATDRRGPQTKNDTTLIRTDRNDRKR